MSERGQRTKTAVSVSFEHCGTGHRPLDPGSWQILHTHVFLIEIIRFRLLRANQIKPFLLWNNVVFLKPHRFSWVGNFTWSIMTFLKAISPDPHRVTLGAAGHCTSVTPLWQPARCDGSICTEWINSSVLLCVRIPKVEQEVQHRVCTCLACWLELNTLFENQDTQGRKWNKFLAFSCIANRSKWSLSVEFCLECSESKWFISYGALVSSFDVWDQVEILSVSVTLFLYSTTHLPDIYWIPHMCYWWSKG